MRASIVRALLCITLGAGVAWIAWRLGGRTGLAFGLLLASPLAALGIAPLLIDAVGESATLARRIAYRDLSGRHVAYKGRALDVREDLSGDRWIRVADVRKVLPGFPRDRVLQETMPEALGLLHPPKMLRISAQGLDAYLARNTDAGAVRFRVWVQRELIDPAVRVRTRGLARQIRIDPTTATTDLSPDPSPAADR